jgi:hypothetical protein
MEEGAVSNAIIPPINYGFEEEENKYGEPEEGPYGD